jgi:hypothetical protein
VRPDRHHDRLANKQSEYGEWLLQKWRLVVLHVLGYPWCVAGSGHLAKNNKCMKKITVGWKTYWQDSQDTSYLADYSYYLTSQPAFMSGYAWPFDATSATNPAYSRGNSTVTAGWSGYSSVP